MPVRKTESKLPFQLNAEDLGQHANASDGKSILISFLTSPVVANRLQQYVVFVTDTSQASTVQEFHWTFNTTGNSSSQTTNNGYSEYTPTAIGALTISVELRNSSGQPVSTIQLQQEVVPPNPELEDLIQASGSSLPVAGNPGTSKEVINDYRLYMDVLVARNADPNATKNSLLFSIAYHEVLRQNTAQRSPILDRIADALHRDDKAEMKDQAREGIGVCRIKPQVLAMYLRSGTSTILPFSGLPSNEATRERERNARIDRLETLTIEQLIDLFNVLRFPKTNLLMCLQLLDEIKQQYFPGNTYQQLVANRSDFIHFIEQFKYGPVGAP